MKKSYSLVLVNISFLLILFPLTLNALTYSTLRNGDWNAMNVWSTDGGLTKCNCYPGILTSGNDILIKHHINLTDNIVVNGGSNFTLSYSSSLTNPLKSITTVQNAYLLFLAPVRINKLINGKTTGTSGSTIDIHHILEINGQVDIYAGDVNLIGGYLNMQAGNFHVARKGNFTTSNGAKLELFLGNINNYGDIFICADCCIETIGNWTNESTGTVLGSGSALTNSGNMKNFNSLPSFSNTITWCSAGNDFGMPSNEDCSSSTLTCGIVQLPTEISKFEGNNHGEYNEIIWTTDSEANCNYFSLQKSSDGFNWTEINTTLGAGNSISTQFYANRDNDIAYITYYRLEQFDNNGDFYRTPPIIIQKVITAKAINIYPNPSDQSDLIHITGIDQRSSIKVKNHNGKQVKSISLLQHQKGHFTFSSIGLNAGVYFIEIEDSNQITKHKKLVIR